MAPRDSVIEVIALLANGNVLLEGRPGLAKTRAIRSLSQALESEFLRLQFTPDLLPSDVTGGEINRAPAKVRSAPLEAIEERQVTGSGTT